MILKSQSCYSISSWERFLLPDPVGDLIEAIRQAKAKAARRGGCLTVVASICGTDQDPQDLEKQKSSLQEAGVFLLPSSARAARILPGSASKGRRTLRWMS